MVGSSASDIRTAKENVEGYVDVGVEKKDEREDDSQKEVEFPPTAPVMSSIQRRHCSSAMCGYNIRHELGSVARSWLVELRLLLMEMRRIEDW